MNHISTILENEQVQEFLADNLDFITEQAAATEEFKGFLKTFIMDHADEFLDSNVDEIRKNIYTFTEVATMQFMHELTASAPIEIIDEDAIAEAELANYL